MCYNIGTLHFPLIADCTQTHFVMESGLSKTSPGTAPINWQLGAAGSTRC